MNKKDKEILDKIAGTIRGEDDDLGECIEIYERIWGYTNTFVNMVGHEEIHQRDGSPTNMWYDMLTAFLCNMMLRTEKDFVKDMLADVSERLDWYEEWNQHRVDTEQMVKMTDEEVDEGFNAQAERIINEEILH
tara:strand:+ start:476 stop:877 length:402 start_codon:yes stop_codon:yes gene_type:complete